MQAEDDNAAQTGTAARHKAGRIKQHPKNKTRPAEKTAGRVHFGKARQFPTSGALAIIVSVRALMIELLT
jgi:hypothetical protein